MVKTTSDDSATARGVSPHFRPASSNHCALDFVRLWPVTVWPAFSRRFAIRLPIVPSPTNPRFAISLASLRRYARESVLHRHH